MNNKAKTIQEMKDIFSFMKVVENGNSTIVTPISEITSDLSNKRNKAILDLQFCYYSGLLYTQEDVIEILKCATSLPTNFPYSNTLLILVLKNTLSVVKFFNDVLPKTPDNLQQRIISHLSFLKRRSFELRFIKDDIQQEVIDINSKLLQIL